MIRRRWRRIAGKITFLTLMLVTLESCGGSGAHLVGTDLEQRPAPSFTLTDQHGATISLSDFTGKAVVLTFVYTHCPDVCPLTAELLRTSWEALSPSVRPKVALLAVTVDPDRDTAEALERFGQIHGLDRVPTWHALRGDPTSLQAVWGAYGIDAIAIRQDLDGADSTPPNPAHTDAIYLIDPKGRERVLLHSSTSAKDLTHDLEALVP